MPNINIFLYKWEGKFFPFKIKSKCGECSLNEKIIKSVIEEIENETDIKINFKEYPWLDNWYKIILKRAYHPPIIFIDNKLIMQEKVITREQLKSAILKQAANKWELEDNTTVIFTLNDCPYCIKAKEMLKNKKIKYIEYEVISSSYNMQKMLKYVLGKTHPIILPQVFINKKRIGGSEDLAAYFSKKQKS